MRDLEFITEVVKLEDIEVDLRVQQPLRRGRVEAMKKAGFKTMFAGMIVVSVREDNSLVVLDGQHRVQAAIDSGVEKLKAQVYYGLTLQEEAEIFSKMNTKNNPSAISKFKVDAKFDPTTAAVNKILADHKWKVVEGGGDGTFNAVAKAIAIYEQKGVFTGPCPGAQVLDWAIGTITGAWGFERKGAAADIVAGLAVIFCRYPDVDLTRLVKALQTVSPDRLRADIRDHRTVLKCQADLGAGAAIHALYNSKVRGDKNKLGIFVATKGFHR